MAVIVELVFGGETEFKTMVNLMDSSFLSFLDIYGWFKQDSNPAPTGLLEHLEQMISFGGWHTYGDQMQELFHPASIGEMINIESWNKYCSQAGEVVKNALSESMMNGFVYKEALRDSLKKVKSPEYQPWEELLEPPIVVIASLLATSAVCCTVVSKKRNSSFGNFFSSILTFQLLACGINIAVFFTPFILWHAQGNFIRMTTSSLEDTLGDLGTDWLLTFYVICQLVYFLYNMFIVARHEGNETGRALSLFHECLKPIKAWINLRYNPGGRLTMFIFADLAVGFLTNAFLIVDRVYKNVFPEFLGRATQVLCLVEAAMRGIYLLRLWAVTSALQIPWHHPPVAWALVYSVASFSMLLTIFSGLRYAKLRKNIPPQTVESRLGNVPCTFTPTGQRFLGQFRNSEKPMNPALQW